MAQVVYVWTGTVLTARVAVTNQQALELPVEVHLTVATIPERVETLVIPPNTEQMIDFTGYTFTEPGVYPAGGYICEPGNPANVYAAIVAERSLEVLETQVVATVDWV